MSTNRWVAARKEAKTAKARVRRKPGRPKKAEIPPEYGPDDGEQPLDYMLRVMRDPTASFERRDAMARAAAQFCHRALKAVELSGDSGGPVKVQIEWLEPSE